MIQKGVPYRVISGVRFYERKEIKDLLAYLRLIYNPADRLSLTRIINVPKRGIGDSSLGHFIAFLERENLSILEGFERLSEIPEFTSRTVKLFENFYRLLLDWTALKNQASVQELTEKILKDSGYLQELKNEGTIEAQGRLENLEEFLALTLEFERNSDDRSLTAFLETVALVSDIDNYETNADAVVMMTLHSAKGLEFPAVFLVGLEEGLFPHSRTLMDNRELEEERRLCYVGITRAKQRLYISHAIRRVIYGSFADALPSRFIREMPPDTLMILKGIYGRTDLQPGSQSGERRNSPASSSGLTVQRRGNPDEIKIGSKVSHPKWGIGTVVTKEGSGPDAQVKVAFPGLGVKSLILAYANLEKAD